MQNSDFWSRITSLYGSQTSPVVLCMKNIVINTRNTCPFMPQPLSVVFACKTAHFGSEFQVSMGPRRHLSFCVCKTAWFTSDKQVSMGTRPHLLFCACKTAWLAQELLVSMCSSPHLTFLDAKQRLSDQNNKSLRVPDINCHFVQTILCD